MLPRSRLDQVVNYGALMSSDKSAEVAEKPDMAWSLLAVTALTKTAKVERLNGTLASWYGHFVPPVFHPNIGARSMQSTSNRLWYRFEQLPTNPGIIHQPIPSTRVWFPSHPSPSRPTPLPNSTSIRMMVIFLG
jgi:hypothetical protein